MSKKYYLIMIAILVVLNVFSWRIWWSYPPGEQPAMMEMMEHRRGRKDGGRGMKVLVDKLNLDKSQKQQFELLRKDYFSEMEGINANLKVLRKELLGQVLNEKSWADKDSIFKLMVTYKMKFEIVSFYLL